MIKIHNLVICSLDRSEGYLLIEEAQDYQCHKFARYAPVTTVKVTVPYFVGSVYRVCPAYNISS
jgi:hypothetical protein